MAGIITRNFRLHNAEQFKEQFSEPQSSMIYLFIARNTSWPDDANPPVPVETINNVEYQIWDGMLAMKRVQSTDVTYATNRYDWTSGTVYTQYTADTNFSISSFFVITDDYNVYKCMFNNYGVQSTVKPTGTSSSVFSTADGYKWKFMYSVTAADALKFLTTSFIPVSTLSSDNGSPQWDVQAAAANGSIEIINVTTAGSGYQFNAGTIASANTSSAVLAASASGTDDIYNGSTIYISSGTGAGQIRTITNYVGATKRISISSAFSPAPDGSSAYIVGPKVNITGDGTGASAYANVASGVLRYVTIINRGANYSHANVYVTANSTHGTGGVITAHISPVGGHGKDAVRELYSHNLILNTKMSGSESNTFFTSNDFRVMGLVVDPTLKSNGAVATASTYRLTTRIVVTSPSGSPAADEKFTGATSGATGRYVERSNTTVMFFSTTTGTFTPGETITGATSGATAVVGTITTPLIKNYTGRVIYFENRSPITRASDQSEDIKMTVKF